jgi:hypothetical protein
MLYISGQYTLLLIGFTTYDDCVLHSLCFCGWPKMRHTVPQPVDTTHPSKWWLVVHKCNCRQQETRQQACAAHHVPASCCTLISSPQYRPASWHVKLRGERNKGKFRGLFLTLIEIWRFRLITTANWYNIINSILLYYNFTVASRFFLPTCRCPDPVKAPSLGPTPPLQGWHMAAQDTRMLALALGNTGSRYSSVRDTWRPWSGPGAPTGGTHGLADDTILPRWLTTHGHITTDSAKLSRNLQIMLYSISS